MNLKKPGSGVLPLFLVIIIDGMGFGMTLPVLVPLLSKTSHNLLGTDTSLAAKHLIFGLIMLIQPLAYIAGAPIIGYWSDRLGRKPMLAICLLGTFISYVIYIASFTLGNLVLLILARLIAGFTTGSQAVAQAAMADISQGRTKVLNIGIIALAMTIGLVAGPLIGGVLSNPQYYHGFNDATPFYFSALLAFGNLLLLYFTLNETYQQGSQKIPNLRDDLSQFLKQTSNRTLLIIFLFFELGWSMYYQGIAVTLSENFHLSGVNVGYFESYVGLALSFGLIYILKLTTRYFSLGKLIRYSLWVGIASLALAFLFKNIIAQIVLAIPITFMVATTYSSLITQLSNQNRDDQQGLLMGVSDATLAIAFAITGFLSGWVTIYNGMLPLIIAAAFMFCALIYLMHTSTQRK